MTIWGMGQSPIKFYFLCMALYVELPVFKASYDLLLSVYQITALLKRDYRYTIGERLKTETLELVILIYKANSSQSKLDVIKDAREKIEVIRLLFRVLKDMKQISLKGLVRINEQIELVSKQLTGWQKSIKK